MKKIIITAIVFSTLLSRPAVAEWSGNVAVELRGFFSQGAWPGQGDGGVSVSAQPEFRHQWNDGNFGVTFIPFARLDSMDDERSHADIRELDFLWVKGDWEFRAGISKVFWGVTETQHLVDIINQTDVLEDIDHEDKLGQPMLRITRTIGNGGIDLFLMPWFRERSFPGVDGRFRPPLVIDKDLSLYESDDEEHHLDWSIRWNQSIDNLDFALSWFQGTSREPLLLFAGDALAPFYFQLKQAGLELQYTGEAWLWKLEAVHRETTAENYNAFVGGFEYTFVGINESAADLGVLLEYNYDSRDHLALTVFENDIFAGMRLALNDPQSSELLAGVMYDLDFNSKSFRLEASRRLGESYKLGVEAHLFWDVDPLDPMYAFRKDDFVQITLASYF